MTDPVGVDLEIDLGQRPHSAIESCEQMKFDFYATECHGVLHPAKEHECLEAFE